MQQSRKKKEKNKKKENDLTKMSTTVKRVGILGLTPEAIDLSAFPGETLD